MYSLSVVAVSLGVSQLLWIILSVIGSVSLLRDSCASLAASSRKRNAPSMTCWLKASDSPGPAVGGVQLFKLHCCGGVSVVLYWFHRCHFSFVVWAPQVGAFVRGSEWLPLRQRLISSCILGHGGLIGDPCMCFLPHWLYRLARARLLGPGWSHPHVFSDEIGGCQSFCMF